MKQITPFPTINLKATGKRILQLRLERNLSIRELQTYFGFENPTAIYRWQRGDNLPSLDNMLALSKLFDVPIEEILVLNPIKPADEQHCTCTSLKTLSLLPILVAA